MFGQILKQVDFKLPTQDFKVQKTLLNPLKGYSRAINLEIFNVVIVMMLDLKFQIWMILEIIFRAKSLTVSGGYKIKFNYDQRLQAWDQESFKDK